MKIFSPTNKNVKAPSPPRVGLRQIIIGRLPSARRNAGRPRSECDEEVLNEINIDSTTLVSAIEAATGVPKSSAHRILKRHRLHPYHSRRVQTLLLRNHPLRIAFCRVMLQSTGKILSSWTTFYSRMKQPARKMATYIFTTYTVGAMRIRT